MPLVVFSHGLGGTRNMYAALASALASQGYLVAAVEHRDGSASYTAIHEKHGVTHKPYVHTDGNFAWRREQIGKRVAELDAAVAALANDAPPRNAFPGSRFDVSAIHGLVDASRLVAMGHSFGGATVVAAAGGRRTRRASNEPFYSTLGRRLSVRAARTTRRTRFERRRRRRFPRSW